jgi:hypothetical protein
MFILKRIKEINNATIGELYKDDKFVCYTLEDKTRPEKIKHETAIPAGDYSIIVNQSPRFKKRLPLLLNVPNFTGIRIHAGNYADNEKFLKNVLSNQNILTESKIRINVI